MAACAIGVLQGDMIIGVYCKLDGEPEITGRILSDHYDCVKSNTLVKYGDINAVGVNIGKPHDADKDGYVDVDGFKLREVSSFFARDGGFEDVGEPREEFFNSDKLNDFYTTHRKVDFTYYRSRSGWHVLDKEKDEWVLISDYLAK